MISQSENSLTILVSLARTDSEKAVVRGLCASYPEAIVIAAHDVDHEPSLNINRCLASSEFFDSQAVLAAGLDAYLDSSKQRNPTDRVLIDGIRCQLFEHNLHELHKWTFSLDQLIRGWDVSKITVLLVSARTSDEIALFEAEGEISTASGGRFLYRRTDYLLHHIHAFFRARGVTQFVRYKSGGRDWLGPVGRRIMRTYGLLAAKGGMHLHHRWRHQFRARPNLARAISSDNVVLSRSVVHSDYVASLVRSGAATPIIMDSALRYPDTLEVSAALFGSDVAHIYDYVSVFSIIKQMSRSFIDLLKIDFGLKKTFIRPFTFEGLQISMAGCLREAVSAGFEQRLLSLALRNYFRAYPGTTNLLHAEMFSPYAAHIGQVCEENQVKCYQLAFGTYEMRPITECVFGNGFLCFSENQKSSLRSVRNYDPKIVYKGNLYLNSSSNGEDLAESVSRRLEARKLVYYAQPYNEVAEDEIIEYLTAFCRENAYKFYIVLHPRGRISGNINSSKFCRVLSNREYLLDRAEFEKDVTLAITRTSNVGYQLLLRSVPLVNLILDDKDLLVKQEYFEKYPLLFYSLHNFELSIGNISSLLVSYYEFRDKFIEKSYKNVDFLQFSKFLAGGSL